MNLDYYLEGSLRIMADRLRIQVRLVTASDGQVSWTRQYDGHYADWAQLHQAIVADLVRQLPFIKEANLFGSENNSTMENQVAWEYLHQARFEAFKWQPNSIMRAIQLLQSAEKLVGNNSVILSTLGRVHLQKREAGIDFTDGPLNEVWAILETLRTTDPDSFYTHSLAGWYHYASGSMHEAILSLKRANQLQPNDADTLGLLANCYLLTGQMDLALPFIEAVQIVDPLTPIVTCLPGWYSLLNGDFKAAIPPYEKMLAMEPYNPVARMFLAWIYALNDDRDALNNLCEDFPEQQHWMLPAVISFAFREALSDEPRDFELSAEQVNMASANEMFARFIAFAFAAHGNVDQAVQWLEKAFELGFWCYPFLKHHEPFLQAHHETEPMHNLLEKIHQAWQGEQVD
jgi:tetratricopeptide (TPR) repeat protein